LTPVAESTPLTVTVDRDGDVVTVVAQGEVDIDNCQRFGDALVAHVAPSTKLRVDLKDVGYMDSSGLRSLLSARAAMEGAGGSFTVSDASSIVRRLLEITGLTSLLES